MRGWNQIAIDDKASERKITCVCVRACECKYWTHYGSNNNVSDNKTDGKKYVQAVGFDAIDPLFHSRTPKTF